jgi:hypothetical protein
VDGRPESRFSALRRVYAPRVGIERVARPTCAHTGLSMPECSCPRCLEAMLLEIQPTLLAEEIKVTRLGARRDEPDASGFREAA